MYIAITIFIPSRLENVSFSGTIAISTHFVASAFSPLVIRRIPSFQRLSLCVRCAALCLVALASTAALGVVEMLLRENPSGAAIFAVVGILRAVQGASTGVIFVIVQVNLKHF